jgi:hypothetical protein
MLSNFGLVINNRSRYSSGAFAALNEVYLARRVPEDWCTKLANPITLHPHSNAEATQKQRRSKAEAKQKKRK